MHFKMQCDKYHSPYNKIIEMQFENKKEVNSYILKINQTIFFQNYFSEL